MSFKIKTEDGYFILTEDGYFILLDSGQPIDNLLSFGAVQYGTPDQVIGVDTVDNEILGVTATTIQVREA